MGSLRLVAILVRRVLDGVHHAVRPTVREAALHGLRLQLRVARVLQVALLLSLDAVTRLVAVDRKRR